MALTPERIDSLIQQADGLAPKEGSIFRAVVKLTEAEVRAQDTALIQKMLEALEGVVTQVKYYEPVTAAITAAHAHLKETAR